MTPRARASAFALLSLSLSATGCGSCGGEDSSPGVSAPDAAPPAAPVQEQPRTAIDLIDLLPMCDVDHRGLLLDLGTAALAGRYGFAFGIPSGLENAEHDGATWAQVFDRRLSLSFTLPEASRVFVETRVVGRDARSAYVTLDDQPLGTLTFRRDQIRLADTPVTTFPLDAGAHTITMRFQGRSKNDHVPFAELDWVRIGVPDEEDATYGAPTLLDVLAPAAALGGVPHHAISLRAPSSVRCGVRVPRSARLRTAVGLDGGDEADVEIRLLSDLEPPVVLQRLHVTSKQEPAWTDVDISLDPFAASVVTIELRVLPGPRMGRVLFGDPAVVFSTPPPPIVTPARAVVIVAMDGLEKAALPPWSPRPTPTLATLSNLALTATTFDRLRAPSSVVSSVVASMLSGLPPRAHTLTDLSARLPEKVTTVATIARDAGVHTAMFTGVPTTFSPFGFAAPWERFVEHPPQSGAAATAPLDDAAAWIQEVLRDSPDARILAFVHARGAHPPWDVTPKELGTLPPSDYAGGLEPRRAAQALAKARQNGFAKALSEQDIERAEALTALALERQDRALGAVIDALTSTGLWDDTLFIVTGDVSSGVARDHLFGDGLELTESVLSLPLYVHFPGDAYGGARVELPAEVYDIARTTVRSLGLSLPKRALGRDLVSLASGLLSIAIEPQVATQGDRFAARWGDLVLSGRTDREPSLCDLKLDPTCAFDRRVTMPFSAQWIFRRVVEREIATSAPADVREPVEIDLDTDAALRVWGAFD